MSEAETFLVVILIVQAIVCAGFCFFIASEKNRDAGGWLMLGFLFGLFAMLALIAVSKIESESETTDDFTQNGDWRCYCTQINPSSDKLCPRCGRPPEAII